MPAGAAEVVPPTLPLERSREPARAEGLAIALFDVVVKVALLPAAEPMIDFPREYSQLTPMVRVALRLISAIFTWSKT